MGLMDKVKAQAEQAVAKGKQGMAQGQAKIEEMQAKKQGDALLRDLGAAVYAQKTGKAGAEADADIERLVSELRAHESEHGAIDTKPTADAEGGGGAGTASEGGEFNLDDV
jgi:hypothetical protein